jgi:hypothetical protein
MKKSLLIFTFLVCSIAGNAQVAEIIKLVTEKLVTAIDLKVQEMQNQVINLQIAQKQAENNLSKNKLAEIAAWEQKQKELYQSYYTSLKQVKGNISGNKNVMEITQLQQTLNRLCSQALIWINQDPYLVVKEKTLLYENFRTIVSQGENINSLLDKALQNNAIQATDAERLELIAQSSNQLGTLVNACRSLDAQARQLSQQRAKSAKENIVLKKLYGL